MSLIWLICNVIFGLKGFEYLYKRKGEDKDIERAGLCMHKYKGLAGALFGSLGELMIGNTIDLVGTFVLC